MSTSISPAYRLSADANTFKVAAELRSLLRERLTELCREHLVADIVAEYDITAKDSQSFPDFFKEAIAELRMSYLQKSSGCGDRFSFTMDTVRRIADYTVVFLHNPVRAETYLHMSSFNLENDFYDSLLELDGIAGDFSYYDNSDSQLEDMTYVEWKDRLAAWEEAANLYKPLSQQGLVLHVFSPFDVSENLLNWTKYESVLSELITERMQDRRYLNLIRNAFGSALVKVENFDMMRYVMDSSDVFNSRDYKSLPFADEYPEALTAAVAEAKLRVAEYPLK